MVNARPEDAFAMEWDIIVGLALIAASILLILAEVLIPSAGILSIVAGACAITGLVFLFRADLIWGIGGLLAVLVLGPMAFGLGVRVLPHTPLGRRMLGELPEHMVLEKQQADEEHRRALASIMGKQGVALTPLRPVGTVEVEGQRFEALAELAAIDAGAAIRVVSVVDNQIKVRPA